MAEKLDYSIGNLQDGQKVYVSKFETPITTRSPLIQTEPVVIPGLSAASAYASGDALGRTFQIQVPTQGVLAAAFLSDMDKEDIATDFILFRHAPTSGTDNSAFDMADTDRYFPAGVITVSTFYDFSDNSLGVWYGARPYVAPGGILWVQAVTRGAPNLTTVLDYSVSFVIEDRS